MPFDNPHELPFGDLETLRTARDRIADEGNWLKSAFQHGDRHCLVGALSVASGSLDFRLPNGVERRLARVLAAQLPPSAPLFARIRFCTARHRLICFNDHARTRHEDVLGLYDRAIDNLNHQAVTRALG